MISYLGIIFIIYNAIYFKENNITIMIVKVIFTDIKDHRHVLLSAEYKCIECNGKLKNKYIYIYMDSQKQLKLCRFPQRTCKLMRLKVVI